MFGCWGYPHRGSLETPLYRGRAHMSAPFYRRGRPRTLPSSLSIPVSKSTSRGPPPSLSHPGTNQRSQKWCKWSSCRDRGCLFELRLQLRASLPYRRSRSRAKRWFWWSRSRAFTGGAGAVFYCISGVTNNSSVTPAPAPRAELSVRSPNKRGLSIKINFSLCLVIQLQLQLALPNVINLFLSLAILLSVHN